VLERTGLVMDEPEALELVKRAGAKVDGTRVRIPGALVERALGTAPRSVTLWDRNGREACRLEGYQTSFGPGSDCMYCLDHRTSVRRRAVLRDVVEAAIVVDACENYDFAMSVFSPSDVTPELLDRYQMEAMLTSTVKPIVFVTFGGDDSHLDAVRMAEVAVGRDQLEAKPIVACYKNTLFPLLHNREALSTLLYLAERNLPCIYSPVSTAGTVAPMTVLGMDSLADFDFALQPTVCRNQLRELASARGRARELLRAPAWPRPRIERRRCENGSIRTQRSPLLIPCGRSGADRSARTDRSADLRATGGAP
jgi:trimethylamine--corrinoid protein Co-methyltransferase